MYINRVYEQAAAIALRYWISMYRNPISNLLRILVWPCILLSLSCKLLMVMTDKGHIQTLGFYIPMIIYFSTIYSVYSFCSSLIMDKSTNFKSLMLSMGLQRISYYLGYSFCFIATTLPPTIFGAYLSIKFILIDTQASTMSIILIYVLSLLQLLAVIFAMSTFITSSSYTALVGAILVLLMQVSGQIGNILAHTNVSLHPYILFMLSASPYASLSIFASSFTFCKNCDSTNYSELGYSQPTPLIIAGLLFWSIVTMCFARWFDEVCPWQTDSAVKHPLFCVRSKPAPHNSIDDIELVSGSKFFEQTFRNREVGIRVRKLVKLFKNVAAVNSVNFDIYKGETTLLLGHNGSGKTTLMNMMLRKLEPDEGLVNINFDHSGVNIGLCPQSSIMDLNLSVRQHVRLFSIIKNSSLTPQERKEDINRCIADVDLTAQIDKLPSELSGGMKRKLSLALAFVGKSKILVLDEPSSGLDPDSRVSVWNAIRRYRSDRTVLLSTQHMDEADYLGDRIAIMSAGRIVCCGSSMFLSRMFGTGYKLRLECKASKRQQVLEFVKRYFEHAQPLEVVDTEAEMKQHDKGDESTEDIVVGLKGDKSKDSDEQMIALLQKIEDNHEQLDIKSFGLKCSSIEDVLLATSKFSSDHSDDSSLKLKLESTNSNISTLVGTLMLDHPPYTNSLKIWLRALLVKHLLTYLSDWHIVIFYRVILVVNGMYWQVRDMNSSLVFSSNLPLFTTIFAVIHFVAYPINERISKFKAMQLSSRCNYVVYWIAFLISDLFTTGLLAASLITFMLIYYEAEFLVSSLAVYSIVALATILLGISAACLGYLMSTIISESKGAVGYLLILYGSSFMFKLLLIMIKLIPNFDVDWLADFIKYFFLFLLPTDAYQYSLYGLVAKCYVKNKKGHCREKDVFSPVSLGLICMMIQIVVFPTCLYLVERFNIELSSYFNIRTWFRFGSSSAAKIRDRKKDEDVDNESSLAAQVIHDASSNHFSLIASQLDKSYVRGLKVVDQLSFTVGRGECFGLLGVNGAGKSTTFSMMAAELRANQGQIWLNGRYANSDLNLYRSGFGYDPQMSPEMSLNARQALTLMANLRLVCPHSIPSLVNSVLQLLNMTEHGRKLAKNLSGGTMRKLALGMTLIGNPSVLLLDEPTAGVDPLARRDIWQLLRSLRVENKSTIVISSHAMEECEAICDRISIMTEGYLRCVGSFLHLRNKFSRGYTIKVQLRGEQTDDASRNTKLVDELNEMLIGSFGSSSVSIADSNLNSASFNINDNQIKRSKLFAVLKEFRSKHHQMSYVINDSSLEDIFLTIAREQQQS